MTGSRPNKSAGNCKARRLRRDFTKKPFTAPAARRYIYHHQRLAANQAAEHENLTQYLRIRHRKHYKKRGKAGKRQLIPNRVSIDQRPPIVETNTEMGHWEADTIIGKGYEGALLTLVERRTKYVLIVKLASKQAGALAAAATKALRRSSLPVKTITFDNGLEFARHESIGQALEAATYFAHPYHSCGPPMRGRGLNENTNAGPPVRTDPPVHPQKLSKMHRSANRCILDRRSTKPATPQKLGVSKPG